MKTKVCFFNLNMDIGGVERQLYYLLNGLDRDKYDIFLILCKKEGDFLKNVFSGVKVINLSIKYSYINIPVIFAKLCFILHKVKPLIFVSFHSNLNCVSILANIFFPVRLVCCFPGYVSKGRVPFFKRILFKYTARLITVSEGVKLSLTDNMGISSKNIDVIDNCIDTEEILKKSEENNVLENIDKCKFIIVSIGRLSKEKSFELLIEAAVNMPEDYIVLIIGDGNNKRNLENLAKQLRVDNKVLFLGSKDNPYKYMKMASVYVLSASSSEGLPTVLLEAMLLEIPCVCPDYYGRTNDVIAHNITGYVFQRNNARELIKIINYIREGKDRNNINAVIRNAKNQALNHSIEKYVRKYEKLFNEI